jgi:hypothetical protein
MIGGFGTNASPGERLLTEKVIQGCGNDVGVGHRQVVQRHRLTQIYRDVNQETLYKALKAAKHPALPLITKETTISIGAKVDPLGCEPGAQLSWIYAPLLSSVLQAEPLVESGTHDLNGVVFEV